MKFPAFAYVAPSTVADTVEILADDEDARPLAGGQSLLPMMALRLAAPSCLVDLNGLDELKEIEIGARSVRIGAMVTHKDNFRAEAHRGRLPLLAAAVQHVAHEAVRNRGTIGGSIAHADVASEMSLVALALDATMTIATVNGERRVKANEFFLGHYTTAVEPGELLTHIDMPVSDYTWAFEEVARRPGDLALVMAAAGVIVNADTCERARIVLGSVADRPLRAPNAEAFLSGKHLNEDIAVEAGRIATADVEMNDDIHATAAYRRTVGAKLITRALMCAAKETKS